MKCEEIKERLKGVRDVRMDSNRLSYVYNPKGATYKVLIDVNDKRIITYYRKTRLVLEIHDKDDWDNFVHLLDKLAYN